MDYQSAIQIHGTRHLNHLRSLHWTIRLFSRCSDVCYSDPQYIQHSKSRLQNVWYSDPDCKIYRYVSNRRFDHLLEKTKGSLHSPQGPLWKNFTRSKHGPDKWPTVLGRVQWRCCSVCKVSPFDVWKQSGKCQLY